MKPHLKVIIPSYNTVKWIRKTLSSVAKQTYRNFDVCVIDDASSQLGQREIIEEFCTKYGWKKIFRQTNCGALQNIVDGIKCLSPRDEDVIFVLDGDDWFYNKTVFKKIAQTYEKEPVNMTYGQFITYPRWQLGSCLPFTQELLNKQNYREVPYVFSHLRTFKFKLWKNIREEDLKDTSGHYFKAAGDLAISYPLLEMTGGTSCKFIDDILYVYNMDNPLNDCVAHLQQQLETAQHIRDKERYPHLFFETCSHYKPRKWQNIRNRWRTIYRKMITPKVYYLTIRKLYKIVLGHPQVTGSNPR